MPKGSRASLRVRVLLLVLLALVPALVFALLAANEERRTGRAKAAADALRVARLIASSQEELAAGARQLLVALAALPDVRGSDQQACGRFLAALLPESGDYVNMFVGDADGWVRCSAQPIERPVDVRDRAWFQRAVSTGSFSFGDYQVGRIVGRPVLVASYPVLDRAGRVRSVVGASLDLRTFAATIDEVALLPSSVVTTLDRNGTVLTRSVGADAFVGRSLPDEPLVRTVLRREEGTAELASLDGKTRLFAFAAARADDDPFAYVAVGMEPRVAYAEADRALRRNIVGLAVLALAGVAVAWVAGGQFIVRPAARIVEATRRLGDGDLGARAGPPYPRGELGELARAFDAAAERLQRQEAERARAQEERLALEAQLHRSQRLESLGQLAGGVAHDFNNLLTAILLYARFIARSLPDGHAARADAEEIARTAERGAQLTHQLLLFGRRDVSDPQVLDIGAVVREMESLLRRTIGEDVALRLALADELWLAELDPGQLEQVIVNLVVNARDAMPEGGAIWIETENVEVDESSTLAVPPGRYVRLTVRDSGTGMTEDVASRAFEPFFTTKPKGEGTGLGLSTVFGIVKSAGGDVSLRTADGGGTSVEIHLPATERARAWTAPARAETARAGSGERILLVEDEEGVRELCHRILERNGYEVLVAEGPEHALALLDGVRVDLLVTDVVMPVMSGKELADRVADRYPGTPVLFMSGYPEHVMTERGILLEGVTLLPKPFTEEELLRSVQDVLGRSVSP